jgi:hypothetical protein
LLKTFTASLIAATLILSPIGAFAQTAAPAPAGTDDQSAQPATPAPKAMAKKPKVKTAQKMAPKHAKAPKAKAPGGDQGQDSEQQ